MVLQKEQGVLAKASLSTGIGPEEGQDVLERHAVAVDKDLFLVRLHAQERPAICFAVYIQMERHGVSFTRSRKLRFCFHSGFGFTALLPRWSSR